MKCEECLPLLDLYSDGELPGRDSDAVAAHLGACASCAGRLQSLRDEQALYLRYECDAAESPEFWDEVLSQIRAEKPRAPLAAATWHRRRLAPLLAALSAPRFSPTLVAALLLAAVGLTAGVMRYLAPREQAPGHAAPSAEVRREAESAPASPESPVFTRQSDEKAVSVADNNGGPRSVAAAKKQARVDDVKRTRPAQPSAAQGPGPDRLVREAEQKYLAAIRILSRDVAGRRTRMDPEALARFERTLGVIDKSIAETRAAARQHPRDPLAVQYMLTAYAKKVEVLREMAQN
jgi:anti-sigma factor RsiW